MDSADHPLPNVPPHRLRLLLTLHDGVELLAEPGPPLFLRWSSNIAMDLDLQTSLDELTGVELPGLSVQALAAEPWWGDRPRDLWWARKLGGTRPPVDRHGPAVRPWVISGKVVGTGPDGDQLLVNSDFVATVTDAMMDQAATMLESLSHRWVGLSR